ncbi:MAG: DsbE family thiol:disulfide interchange protein [Pseudomonadota bacterium]
MKRFVIPVALFAVLGLLLGYAIYEMQRGDYSPRTIPSPLIGKPLPALSLPTVADPKREVGPAQLRGRVYLLNVWASWCVSCRVEHPLLNELARNKTVTLIGLNYKDQRQDALAWLKDMGNPYETSLSDLDGRFGIEIGVYGVPETFVIDKEGIIRYKHIGPLTPAAMEQKLLPLIKDLS